MESRITSGTPGGTTEVWMEVIMTAVGQDIRYACHSLRSKPGYAAAVVLLMALGIGATTAAFSAVNGILWIRFPYPDANRLVVPVSMSRGGGRANVTYADYRDWREMRDVFEHVAVFATGEVDLAGTGEPETIGVAQVSEEYFATLGLQPSLGRAFRPQDHSQLVFLIHQICRFHGLLHRSLPFQENTCSPSI